MKASLPEYVKGRQAVRSANQSNIKLQGRLNFRACIVNSKCDLPSAITNKLKGSAAFQACLVNFIIEFDNSPGQFQTVKMNLRLSAANWTIQCSVEIEDLNFIHVLQFHNFIKVLFADQIAGQRAGYIPWILAINAQQFFPEGI